MSLTTRTRGERGDENADDSDRATHPSPRQQHTDSSGDDSDSEGSRSATSRLWQVLHDPSAYKDEYIDLQPQAFLALIEDVLCDRRDEVDYRVRLAARSILSSRIFDKFFKQLFINFLHYSSDLVDEFRLLQWIDSFRLDMSRAEESESNERLYLIDRIVSHIIFTMWDGKDWLLDRLLLIERIIAFIADQMDGKDKMDDLCPIKQIVSFIRKIIEEKDGRIDKLCVIWRISNVIVFPFEDSRKCIDSALIITKIANYLDGLVLKKDDLVDQLNLIDLIISYLDVKRAEKGAEVDKLCLIQGMASFIDGIIIDKDDQVGKLGQIMQIVKLLEDIDEFGSDDYLCNLELMKHIVTLLEMIKGEKDGLVDKLSLMEHIVPFLQTIREGAQLINVDLFVEFIQRRKIFILLEEIANLLKKTIKGEKDNVKFHLIFFQVKKIISLVKDTFYGMDDKLSLMEQIVTFFERMINGEKNHQLDKLQLIQQIITFFEDDFYCMDDPPLDKLELMQHIVSWTKRKLLGHGSSRSVDEALDQELEGRILEIQQPMEAPTQDTINDESTMVARTTEQLEVYKGKSKYRKFFKRHEDKIHWLCILCEEINHPKKESLQRNKYSSTTIFQRHLKKYHKDIYKDIKGVALKH